MKEICNTSCEEGSENALKSKIFMGGLFGLKASNFTKKELEEISTANWAEIATPEQITALKKNFNLSSIESLNNFTNEDNIVRMNTLAWRNYAVGENYKFTGFNVFLVLDYLIQANDYVDASKIREHLKINPKDLFYILKTFKEKNLISQNKLKNMNLVKYTGRSAVISKEPVFCDTIETRKYPVIYKNYPLDLSLMKLLLQTKEGMASTKISEKLGITKKQAFSLIKTLSINYSDQFVIQEEKDYKTTVKKMYAKKHFESINDERKKRLGGDFGAKEIENLRTDERQKLIKIFVDKYRILQLDQPLMKEMASFIGYKYSFDRKNVLKMAEKLKIKILKIDGIKMKIFLIADDVTDEELKILTSKHIIKHDPYRKQLIDLLVGVPEYKAVDNLYINSEYSHKLFLELLLSKFDRNTNIQFDGEIILNMKIKEFLSINRINPIHFLQRLSIELFKTRPEIFPGIDRKFSKFDDIFEDNEIKLYSKEILYMVNIVKDLNVRFVVENAKNTITKSFEYGLSPLNYHKKFCRLENLKTLKYQKTDVMIFNLNGKAYEHVKFKKYPSFYNKSLFLSKIINMEEEYLKNNIDQIIDKECREDEKEFFIKKFNDFFNKKEISSDENPFFVFTINNMEIYKIVKYYMMRSELTLENIKKYYNKQNIDFLLNEVFEYMFKNKVIGKNIANISKITFSIKYRRKIKYDIPQEPYSNLNYYAAFKSCIYKFIEEKFSVDFDALIENFKYFEKFEMNEFIETFNSDLEIEEIMGFKTISLRNKLNK
ncbi:hypothetical protein NUSPORA_00026 [Nucleospora cyclopteri]